MFLVTLNVTISPPELRTGIPFEMQVGVSARIKCEIASPSKTIASGRRSSTDFGMLQPQAMADPEARMKKGVARNLIIASNT